MDDGDDARAEGIDLLEHFKSSSVVANGNEDVMILNHGIVGLSENFQAVAQLAYFKEVVEESDDFVAALERGVYANATMTARTNDEKIHFGESCTRSSTHIASHVVA
jgi:hypothetical protein